MPPTRQFSRDEKNSILQKFQVDAIILVGVTQSGADEVYVPPSLVSNTTGNISDSPGGLSYNQSTSVNTIGGYTMSKPWANTEVRLLDGESRQVAWMGSSNTKGNAFATPETILDSLANEAAQQLSKDGLLYVQPRKRKG